MPIELLPWSLGANASRAWNSLTAAYLPRRYVLMAAVCGACGGKMIDKRNNAGCPICSDN